ncbi:MAG: aminotransferase [Dehalococcoidia bacterium]|nr:MAG: aminotransferase [Dehalococcoidia bacterium]
MATRLDPVANRNQVAKVVRDLPPSGIRRFFDLLSTLENVISLGVGEPDFVTPWHIREAAMYGLERGQTSYTSNYGLLELRTEIARHLRRHYGLEYDPTREVLVTVGVSEGLDLAMRAILDPGDEVLCPDPGYVSYRPCILLAGGQVVPVPTGPEHQFVVRVEELEARLTPRTKAVLLGYPSNPTGAVLRRQDAAAIVEFAVRHDLIVVADEIYDRLVYGVEHVCLASLPGARERTILLNGFSKAYAMTGWRVGYACARPDLIEAMMKIHQYTMLCAPVMAQLAAIEALRHGERAVQEMVEEYDRRRRVMVNGFRQLGLECFEPQGAFYAFPSIRRTGLSSDQFAERLLAEERVAVVPGSAFGEMGEGYVRCCYATSLAEIEEALARIGRFLDHLERGKS